MSSIVQLNGNKIIQNESHKKTGEVLDSSIFTNNFKYQKYSPFALEFK
jgi:hypothetical protein